MKNIINHLISLREQKRLFKEKAGQDNTLNVMNDKVFKLMLSSDSEDSREALRYLLSACTRREVKKVSVLNSELLPPYIEAKSPRLDVRATFNDGEVADLEMQMAAQGDSIKDRASQYISMLHAGQAKRGKRYKEAKRVYQIFFLNFELFPGSDKLVRRYSYREETEHDLLTDSSEIIFYELPKLEKREIDYSAGKIDFKTLSLEEKWCIYMKYRHDQRMKHLISELCSKEEGIMRAEKEVIKINRSWAKYMRNISNEKDKIDRAYELRDAYKKGGEERDKKWQTVVAENEARLVEKDAKLADNATEIEQLRSQIEELQAGK